MIDEIIKLYQGRGRSAHNFQRENVLMAIRAQVDDN